MPKNVEIKARAIDFESQKVIAAALSDTPLETLRQRDTFFNISQGRLKLRAFNANHGQLILYTRSDQTGPTVSEYQITETADPEGLKKILNDAYGVAGQVNKTRYLYFNGRTRIHFDQVESLGDFIELEVVLNDDEDHATGEIEAKELMDRLNIQSDDLIEVAYADLLADKQRGAD